MMGATHVDLVDDKSGRGNFGSRVKDGARRSELAHVLHMPALDILQRRINLSAWIYV